MFTRDQITATLTRLYPTMTAEDLARLADGHMEQQAIQQAPGPGQHDLYHPTYRDMGPGSASADVPDEPMTQDAYRKAGGNCCPVCHDWDIEGGSIEIESGTASQRCRCHACEAGWTDFYRLAAYARTGETGEDVETDMDAFYGTEVVVRQPGPAPQPAVYVVTYGHKHGTDVSVYSTEAKAQAAMEDIKAAYPDEFDEDDPRSWLDLTASTLDA
jgi:hypothetical protein